MKATRYFVSVFIVCWWVVADVSGNCNPGKFGSNCEYDCHCGVNGVCNQTTGCNGNCAQSGGWFGSTCQARNVALRRNASHSPASFCEGGTCYNADLAVDGIRGHSFFEVPCSQAGQGSSLTTKAEWHVTLNQPYDIYRFIIDNRNDGTCCKGRINRFILSVGQSSSPSGSNYSECYRDTTPGDADSAGPGDVIHGHCNSTLRGDVIQIRQTNDYPLTLCEVLVYICSTGWYGQECTRECRSTTNCKQCYQNQTQCQECVVGKWDEHCEQPCYCLNEVPCDKANGQCPNGQCAAGYKGNTCATPCDSGEYGPDCAQSCGFCADGRNNCNITTGHCPTVSPRCQAGYHGDKCDQECVEGRYGADCTETCGQCFGGQTVCNKLTGRCPDNQPARCVAGWSGDQCKTACVPGQYGADCSERCGQCSGGQNLCDTVTGTCPDNQTPRCTTGWSGDKCKTACVRGQYGADCSERCGQCSGGQTLCDIKTGRCPDNQPARCKAGWSGDKCKTECKHGRYGTNCAEYCGECVRNQTCKHTDGRCEVCAAGWKGNLCKENCKDGNWGENCKFNCSVYCIDVMNCDIFNGSCVGGCKAGYLGDRCEPESLKAKPSPTPVEAIVLPILFVVIIALIVVAFVLVRRRKKTPKAQRESNKMTATSTTRLDTDSLDNLSTSPETGKTASSFPVSASNTASEYYNVVDFIQNVSAVPVDQFWEYVSKKKADGGLKTEYEKLPRGLQANHDVAKIPENKGKSRYLNIVAYDHSRVVLRILDNDPNSTYINACYVHGYKQENKYIASQGPTLIIINDFMRMIWEQDCGKIVMLTNLIEDMTKKCDQYWPNSGVKEFGLIQVTLVDEEEYADFTVRVLQLTHSQEKGKTKVVTQFHFTAWPDHGVPHFATALLNFREKILTAQTPHEGPLLVHCSAGIGRTGTFIGVDYLMDQAKAEGVVDVMKTALMMRKQRVNMIQTQEQYQFLHEAVVEALKLSDCATIPSAQFQNTYNAWETKDPDTGKIQLNEQFKALKEMTVLLEKSDLEAALRPENKSKNRSAKILAGDSSRPFLSTPVPDGTDYINAVFLPAYKMKKAFITTQMPMSNTVVDFWRLIYEQGVSTVVMLNVLPEGKPDKSVGVYWTDNVPQFEPFVVETLDTQTGEFCDVRTLQIYYKKEKDRKYKIKQFQCKFWPDNKLNSATSEGILSVLDQVEHWQQQTQNGPVLVHCMDGVTQCGVYCAASSVIERLKLDQEVNILHTIKQMRIHRPEVITDLEQFRFLHQLVLAYLEQFQTYSNFK